MEKKQESIFSFIFLKNLASFRNVKFWVQDLVISSDNESGLITWLFKLHLNFPPKSHGTGAISFSCSAQKRKKEKSKEYLIFLRFCMLLLTLQKSKPRASLLISVLLKMCRKEEEKSTHCLSNRKDPNCLGKELCRKNFERGNHKTGQDYETMINIHQHFRTP